MFPTRAEKMKITREKNIRIAIEKCEMMKQYNIDIVTMNKIFHTKNQKAKAEEMYNKLASATTFADQNAGWIYCRSDGKCDGEYKCGFTKQGKTRQEAEQKLFERLRTDIRNPRIYHMVPVLEAQVCEKILFGWLSDYHIEREFFRVDDVKIIIDAMNKLPF